MRRNTAWEFRARKSAAPLKLVLDILPVAVTAQFRARKSAAPLKQRSEIAGVEIGVIPRSKERGPVEAKALRWRKLSLGQNSALERARPR